MNSHPARIASGDAERGNGLRPKQARRAQLGDFKEVVRADAENELDSRRRVGGGLAGLDQSSESVNALGESVGQLLHCRRAAVVEPVAADRAVGNRQVLRDRPARSGAPREGVLVGSQIGLAFQPGEVLTAVIGLNFEPFFGAPHKPLLVVGAFQIGRDNGFPGGGGYWRKLGGQVQRLCFFDHIRHGARPPERLRSDS